MPVTILKIDPAVPDAVFARCGEIVKAGGVIVYPTDTFYGLGADPRNRPAVRKLFNIKDRPPDQPVLLLIAGPDDVRDWAAEIPETAVKLMQRFWPGPLTLVLKAKADVAVELTAGTGTIGLRVPGSDLTRSLLRAVGRCLTGTSANRSGEPSPCSARAAAAALGGGIDLVLDGGDTTGGRPSTVVDLSGGLPRVIREGVIAASAVAG